jgi:hypothetical protein
MSEFTLLCERLETMKNPTLSRLIQTFLSGLLFVASTAFAGAPDPLADMAAKLREDRIKAENQNAESMKQLTDIEVRKAALEMKKREIEEANAKTLSAVQTELTPEAGEKLMSMTIQHCKITREGPNAEGNINYLIENTDAEGNVATIRFHFNNVLRTSRMPIAKPFQTSDGTQQIEVTQPRFDPKAYDKDGFMSARIIYNPDLDDKDPNKVSHAVFTGARQNDIGFWPIVRSSDAAFTISCMIN